MINSFCCDQVLHSYPRTRTPSRQPTDHVALPWSKETELCCLWLDISGYSRLAEELARHNQDDAPGQLFNIVNPFFQQAIDAILQHGGDVLKFCGDALLCTFRDVGDEANHSNLTADELLSHYQYMVARACVCAERLQQISDSYEFFHPAKQRDTKLRVKIVISFGRATMMMIGGVNSRSEFLITGDPMIQIIEASQYARSGKTILSAVARSIVGDELVCAKLARPRSDSDSSSVHSSAASEVHLGHLPPRTRSFRLERQTSFATTSSISEAEDEEGIAQPEAFYVVTDITNQSRKHTATFVQVRLADQSPRARFIAGVPDLPRLFVPAPVRDVVEQFTEAMEQLTEAETMTVPADHKLIASAPLQATCNVSVLFIKVSHIVFNNSNNQDHENENVQGNTRLARHSSNHKPHHQQDHVRERSFSQDSHWSKHVSRRVTMSLHDTLKAIQENLYKHNGLLRQMTCDDKGYVVIGVFGASGETASQSSATATPISMAAHQAVDAANEISALLNRVCPNAAGIGVASGPAFCGIMGDIQKRCEYAVMGHVVNSAARLMELASQNEVESVIVDEASVQLHRQHGDAQVQFKKLKENGMQLRGLDENVNAYGVMRKSQRRRKSVVRNLHMTPLVPPATRKAFAKVDSITKQHFGKQKSSPPS